MKVSNRRTSRPKGTTMQKRKTIHVKPLTVHLQQDPPAQRNTTRINSPSRLFGCSRIQSSSPSSSISLTPFQCHLFVKEVPPLCQRSMELQRYITAVSSVFCQKSTLCLPKPLPPRQLTRSLSTEVTAVNTNETPAPPRLRLSAAIVLFSPLSQHSARQILDS